MKGIAKYLFRAGAAVGITGTFQVIALYAFLSMTVYAPSEKMGVMLRYGIPIVAVLLSLFFISIPLMGLPIFRFIIGHERGEKFNEEEIGKIQRKIVNYPYQIGVMSFLFWFISAPFLAILVKVYMGLSVEQISYAIIGGIIGGLLNMPISVYATNLVTPPIMEMTYKHGAKVERGGRIGIPLSISRKLLFAFTTVVMSFTVYIGVVGYAQMMRASRGYEVGGDVVVKFIVLVLCALAMTTFLAYLAARDITAFLAQLKEAASHFAKGEFAERAHVFTNDELGELAAVINTMAGALEENERNLDNVRSQLEEASADLTHATREIMDIAQEQSAGAVEQVASMKQISATQESILDTARHVVEAAARSERMAGEVLDAAVAGGNVVSQTVGDMESLKNEVTEITMAMDAVGETVKRIAKTLRTIEDISERTNILSLNVSLEAAGAGAEGRRFSVVADQVRRLAERTRMAAREVNVLINDIVETTQAAGRKTLSGVQSADRGVLLVRNIHEGLALIDKIARLSSDDARAIELTSQQQRTALEQAVVAINQVSNTAENVLGGARRTEKQLAAIDRLSAHIRGLIIRSDKSANEKKLSEENEEE